MQAMINAKRMGDTLANWSDTTSAGSTFIIFDADTHTDDESPEGSGRFVAAGAVVFVVAEEVAEHDEEESGRVNKGAATRGGGTVSSGGATEGTVSQGAIGWKVAVVEATSPVEPIAWEDLSLSQSRSLSLSVSSRLGVTTALDTVGAGTTTSSDTDNDNEDDDKDRCGSLSLSRSSLLSRSR
jgi:hypothetical protein